MEAILRKLGLLKYLRCWRKAGKPFPRADREQFFRDIKNRGLDAQFIIDVGANMGRWSREALYSFPHARYMLLEPQREMKNQLDELCAEYPNAEWMMAGVASRDGKMDLAVIPENEGCSSSFLVPESERQKLNLESRSLPVYSLDSICKNAGQIPELVKLDAEGMEMQIIKGAQSLLGTTEVFLLEVSLFNPWPGGANFVEIIHAMDELGYVPYDFTEFIFRPKDGALGLVEIAFSKKQGVLRNHLGWN